MIQPEHRLSSLLHEMLHLLHEKNPSDSRRHWTPLNKYHIESDNILTNSWLITQSDPFFNLTKSYGVPLSTMSYVLCETSSTTGSQQESRRLEKDCSDISKKHATQPAVFSQSAKAAAHSHRKEPLTQAVRQASCPVISLLKQRSRYKYRSNIKINHLHILRPK